MEIKTKFNIGDRVLVKSEAKQGVKPIIFKVTAIEVWVCKPESTIIQDTRYTLMSVTSEGPTLGMGTTTSEADLILATEAAVKKEFDIYMKYVKESLMENCYQEDKLDTFLEER